MPWLWLGLLTLLLAGVIGQTGSWPSYGQPDPKQISGLSLLVMPITLIMLLTLASLPFNLVITAVAIQQGWPTIVDNKKHTVLYLLGVFLFLLMIFGDLAGIMTWLVD